MSLKEVALNEAANGVGLDTIKLHSGDPGDSGTANLIAGAVSAVNYGNAVAGVRDLTEDLNIPIPEGETVSHYSLYEGPVLKDARAFTSNAETYNNAGTATISTLPFSVTNP